jgi:hypothetical protein
LIQKRIPYKKLSLVMESKYQKDMVHWVLHHLDSAILQGK